MATTTAKPTYWTALNIDPGASESENVRGRWELRDTGLTIGEHFRGLDRAGQRAYIAESIILAERDQDGKIMVGEIILSDDDGCAIDRWV